MISERHNDRSAYRVATTLAACGIIPYGNFAQGEIHVAPNSKLTALTWYSSPDGVSFYPVQDGAGNALANTTVTPSTTGCAVAMPLALASCQNLKALATFSDGTTVDTISLTTKF